MQVILASNSPRRRELFAKICPSFLLCPANADETVPPGTPPCDAVEMLARRKAEASFQRVLNAGMVPSDEPIVVLGADTVVAFEGEILGKPKDEADAFCILKKLSGQTHHVYTGICFVTKNGTRVASACSQVRFHALTDEFIRAYIATGSPMDKAGAYGIQDGGLVESYAGSYTNIVGLPLELTEKIYEEVVQKC